MSRTRTQWAISRRQAQRSRIQEKEAVLAVYERAAEAWQVARESRTVRMEHLNRLGTAALNLRAQLSAGMRAGA